MKHRFRTGGLAAWSIRRPISVSMLALSVVVIGFFSIDRLGIDLLPHIIYPEVRVRIIDPGVPAKIMEDQVTRQLEEQLAITEGAVAVQSSTLEGQSRVDISFPYGTDIDAALTDASHRLDRAKRFLPDTIDPPVIYKRDPSQIPVLELAISSNSMDPVKLREWVDYDFSRWFINLPGVASAEIGGGNRREIQINIDQERLASFGLDFDALINKIRDENIEVPGGRLLASRQELSTRAQGRFASIQEIRRLPIGVNPMTKEYVRLGDIAQVLDLHEDERMRVRLNGDAAIKLSVQKQPQANTVTVVDAVNERLDWLATQKLIPSDIRIARVSDQSTFVRHALRNAATAAISGAILAMLVVYVFLGNLRRTLIIGMAIPLAILVTFMLMAVADLTLNIMTLGGLALGVGLLIDSTIIMLENITRHQREGEAPFDASLNAAREINSAVVASASTNLAAILPFLFVGGLIGLLYSELIYTLSSAIAAALIVSLTLVPSYAARVLDKTQSSHSLPVRIRRFIDRRVENLKHRLARLLAYSLNRPVQVLGFFIGLFLIPVLFFVTTSNRNIIPSVDEGQIHVRIKADPGTQFSDLDRTVLKLEALFRQQPEVDTVFTTSGVFIFGRTERLSSNTASIYIQLRPGFSSEAWIRKLRGKIHDLELAGYSIRLRARGVRGLRLSHGDDDISLRVQGPDLDTLAVIGDDLVDRLKEVDGLRNLEQTYEELREELNIQVNRERAVDLGVSVKQIGTALRVALEGFVVSEYLDGDRQFDIRLRLPPSSINSPDDIGMVIVGMNEGRPVRLSEVAQIDLAVAPATIMRDNQRRIVEVSASLVPDASLGSVLEDIAAQLSDVNLPEGYNLYDGGLGKTLQQGEAVVIGLLLLAVFLVFVVMAIQYESLLNPIVIIFSVLFASIGVVIGLIAFGLPDWIHGAFDWLMGNRSGLPDLKTLPVTIPVWLGMIMLAGIVVNNAIVLVEQIEIEREQGKQIREAIIFAAQLRLRPILMTTLTTVAGMLPLAIGLGRGSEMLQPLALVIVWGLSFSVLVTLALVPTVYDVLHRGRTQA